MAFMLTKRRCISSLIPLALIPLVSETGMAAPLPVRMNPAGQSTTISASCNNLKLIFDMKALRFKLYGIGYSVDQPSAKPTMHEIAQGRIDQASHDDTGQLIYDVWGELDGNAGRTAPDGANWIGKIGIITSRNAQGVIGRKSIGFWAPYAPIRIYKLCDDNSSPANYSSFRSSIPRSVGTP